jgi:hypothetical protein
MADTNQNYGSFVALSIIEVVCMDGRMVGILANEKPLLLVIVHELDYLFRLFVLTFLVLELF